MWRRLSRSEREKKGEREKVRACTNLFARNTKKFVVHHAEAPGHSTRTPSMLHVILLRLSLGTLVGEGVLLLAPIQVSVTPMHMSGCKGCTGGGGGRICVQAHAPKN